MPLLRFFDRVNQGSTRHQVGYFLLLILLASLSASQSVGLAHGLKIDEDSEKNVNVTIEENLVPKAQIKRTENQMVIQVPENSGFDASKLMMNPALKGKVDVVQTGGDKGTPRKTVVTIHSGNIYLNIQNQQAQDEAVSIPRNLNIPKPPLPKPNSGSVSAQKKPVEDKKVAKPAEKPVVEAEKPSVAKPAATSTVVKRPPVVRYKADQTPIATQKKQGQSAAEVLPNPFLNPLGFLQRKPYAEPKKPPEPKAATSVAQIKVEERSPFKPLSATSVVPKPVISQEKPAQTEPPALKEPLAPVDVASEKPLAVAEDPLVVPASNGVATAPLAVVEEEGADGIPLDAILPNRTEKSLVSSDVFWRTLASTVLVVALILVSMKLGLPKLMDRYPELMRRWQTGDGLPDDHPLKQMTGGQRVSYRRGRKTKKPQKGGSFFKRRGEPKRPDLKPDFKKESSPVLAKPQRERFDEASLASKPARPSWKERILNQSSRPTAPVNPSPTSSPSLPPVSKAVRAASRPVSPAEQPADRFHDEPTPPQRQPQKQQQKSSRQDSWTNLLRNKLFGSSQQKSSERPTRQSNSRPALPERFEEPSRPRETQAPEQKSNRVKAKSLPAPYSPKPQHLETFQQEGMTLINHLSLGTDRDLYWVTMGNRNLVIAATAQQMTLVTQFEQGGTPAEALSQPVQELLTPDVPSFSQKTVAYIESQSQYQPQAKTQHKPVPQQQQSEDLTPVEDDSAARDYAQRQSLKRLSQWMASQHDPELTPPQEDFRLQAQSLPPREAMKRFASPPSPQTPPYQSPVQRAQHQPTPTDGDVVEAEEVMVLEDYDDEYMPS